ncbi:MAG: hypothetical protein KDI98_00695 [Hyphomicrobiaceae bacterium]|nr:hypothetical protein [Hyphomicrobiaceae bacterium]
MRHIFSFLNLDLFAPLFSSAGLFAVSIYVLLPLLAGLLGAWGDWRVALKAYLIWAGLLVSAFWLMTWNIEHTIYGVTLYGMFFSIVAVPLIALAIRLWRTLRGAVAARWGT